MLSYVIADIDRRRIRGNYSVVVFASVQAIEVLTAMAPSAKRLAL